MDTDLNLEPQRMCLYTPETYNSIYLTKHHHLFRMQMNGVESVFDEQYPLNKPDVC